MVFSGIVEAMGEVVSLTPNAQMTLWDGSVGEGTELVVRHPIALDGAYVGCSIAVDGVCLTATRLDAEDASFAVGLSPETLRRTTLGLRRPGDRVNLERALAADARNSGHYVQGHVDGVATIEAAWSEGDSRWLRLRPPGALRPYLVEKGFVAVDGASLTVCDVDEATFTLMLVEHTQKLIVLPSKAIGDTVNLEVDVMAKYAAAATDAMTTQLAALATRLDALETRLAAVEADDSAAGTDCTGLD